MTARRADPAVARAGEVAAVLREAEDRFAAASIASARADAELLLAAVLEQPRGRIGVLAVTGGALSESTVDAYRRLVDRREAREPLQHLTGRAPFRTLELAVGPGAFVPRPETEGVAQLAIDALRRVDANDHRPSAVDLGTGSGAIALALAAEVPAASVVGVEGVADAFVWARENAAALGLPNVRMVFADLAVALPDASGSVDVVVSNPPYVPDGMVPRDPEVRLFDPASALFGGPDGLAPMRDVVRTAARLLRPSGVLVVEHGEHQGAEVRALLDPGHWAGATTHPDLTDRDRATTASRR